jgi:hypothetical protein
MTNHLLDAIIKKSNAKSPGASVSFVAARNLLLGNLLSSLLLNVLELLPVTRQKF